MAAIDRDFDSADLDTAIGGRVDRTVLVQTACTTAETMWLLETAATTPVVESVVGWVDLTAADVTEAIRRLQMSPHGSLLSGIRHQVQAEPDPHWLARADVLRGLKAVGAAGLVYDILTLPHQLDGATAAVERLPQVVFVLDHLSKPDIRSGEYASWATDLRRLARHPNVHAKLSGLVTEADWHTWTVADLRPVVDVAIDAFGPERLLVGSDWPVCLLAATYDQVMDTAEELTGELAGEARERVFGGNAYRLYGRPA